MEVGTNKISLPNQVAMLVRAPITFEIDPQDPRPQLGAFLVSYFLELTIQYRHGGQPGPVVELEVCAGGMEKCAEFRGSSRKVKRDSEAVE